MPSVRISPLLSGLIDYAGLFPPASQSLPEAIRDYAEYLRRGDGGILARFIVPITRVHELGPHLDLFDQAHPLRLSLLAPPGSAAHDMSGSIGYAVSTGDAFASATSSPVSVEIFETRLPDDLLYRPGNAASDLASAGARTSGRPVYVELPVVRRPEESAAFLAVVAELRASGATNLGVKVRCGGTTESDYPSPAALALFLSGCCRHRIPFKATAGLHHPVRAFRPDEGVRMHGFVNVFVAATLGFTHHLDAALLETILQEEDAHAFGMDRGGVAWRDLSASKDEVKVARATLAHAFGSCSFDEPTTDLRGFGWLAGTATGQERTTDVVTPPS